ncbi:ribonuclease H-like domain-containing protein [Tanacetum coccineum]
MLSSSKKGDSVMDMDEEGCDEGTLESGGVGDGVSVVDEAKLIFGSICKDPKVSINANVSSEPGVSVNYATVNDVHMSNSSLGSNGNDFVPKIPVPFDMNPILNPNGNSNHSSSGNKVNLTEVKVPGIFKIVGDGSMLNKGVGSVSNFGVGQHSEAVGREVAVMDPVLEEGTNKWSMTVVGHFVGFQMGYREIIGHLKRMWRLYQLEEVIVNQRMYYFNFKSHEGMQCMIENRPWMVENKPLFVRKWEPGLCMSKLDTSKLPLWVKIYDIPLEAWNIEGISRIASRIGVPIIMDKITTSIYEKPYGRVSYARVLVEVDAAKGLVDFVEIWYKSLGKSMILNVEYVWRPSLCDHCKTFGHHARICSKSQGNAVKKVNGYGTGMGYASAGNMGNEQDGWQNVDNKRDSRNVRNSYHRGSYNGYTRGVADEVIKGRSDVELGSSSGKDRSKKVAGDEESNGKSNDINMKESFPNKYISTQNRFDVLNEDSGDEVSDVWKAKWKERPHANSNPAEFQLIKLLESLHSRIAQLNRGLHVNARSNALKLVKESIMVSGAEGEKGERKRAEVYLFLLSKQPLSKELKGMWTDDMMEYYAKRCDEIKDGEKNGHYVDGDVSYNMEEVDEDYSKSVSFVAQNEVLNDIDVHSDLNCERMENTSGVGGSKGGKPLKSILKKTNYTPLINVAVVANVSAGTSGHNDGMLKGVVGKSSPDQKKVLIAKDDTTTVWEFDSEIDGSYVDLFNDGSSQRANEVKFTTNGVSDSYATSSEGGSITAKRVDFRTFVNEERVENVDTVLPLSAIEKAQFGLQNLMKNDDGVFLFKFESKEGLEKVLERGPWIILVAYSADGLSLIATQVGKPIMLDAFTSSMSENAWGRIRFARALMELNVKSGLKHEVSMDIPLEDGSGHTKEVIKVEYEWKPPHCVECKIFGHINDKCPKRVTIMETPAKNKDRNTPSTTSTHSDGFTEVRRKKNKGKKAEQQPSKQIEGIRLNKQKSNFCWQKKGTNVKREISPSTSNSFDALNNMEVGAASSRDTKEDDQETGPNTSQWNEDQESDNEVDEFIFPEGDKFGEKFDIRLKGRVRK